MPFILYRSSAGSGKTYTLVREYLRLALTSPMQFRHILAITFTNKAADEMRQRITGTLARLSEGGEECMKGMGAELTLLLGIDGKELASRSGKVLREILHGYEEFSVGTIDSFMHRIIRIFARDIHLPLRFEVEMDRDELLARAIDLLISRVGPDSVVTDILVNFIEHKFRESGNWRIEKDITEVARELFMESGQKEISRMSRTSPSDILAAADKIIAWNSHLRRTVSEAASVAIHAIKASGIQMDSFYRGNAGIAKYFEYIAQGNLSKWKPNSYVITTVEENKWFSSKCPASEKEAIEGIRDVLLGAFHEIQEKGSRKIPKYLFYEMVIKNIYPFSLLVEVEKHLEEIKSSRQVIHISEFNRRIAAIAMNEPAPFIYERLGQKYRHFLLDEFQDTSVLQWQNLLPLVENSLSEGHTTLVVGDGKQAIYRWRNGEVEQFVRLPEIYNAEGHPWMQQRESILRATFEPRELKMNYRSGPGIIEFNNGFFTFVAGSSDSRLRSIYQGLVQEYPGGNENGRVQIEFLDDSGPTSDYEQKSLKRVMELVEKHTGMGYRLRDIAVLCRKNEEASLMARYLLQQGYPVVSAESLHLDASREVNFLMACLKYMVDPDDMTAVAHILNFLSVTGRIPGDLHNLIAEYVHYTEPGTNGARDLFNYLTALGLPVCRNTIEGQSHFEIL
ncbi:MAG: UvrD-helicase domain-containing protein, partial [Bacteroidales bacterium]|nr:UvrD-helicase domain-containing protein [Bacteroidales bacterium]